MRQRAPSGIVAALLGELVRNLEVHALPSSAARLSEEHLPYHRMREDIGLALIGDESLLDGALELFHDLILACPRDGDEEGQIES